MTEYSSALTHCIASCIWSPGDTLCERRFRDSHVFRTSPYESRCFRPKSDLIWASEKSPPTLSCTPISPTMNELKKKTGLGMAKFFRSFIDLSAPAGNFWFLTSRTSPETTKNIVLESPSGRSNRLGAGCAHCRKRNELFFRSSPSRLRRKHHGLICAALGWRFFLPPNFRQRKMDFFGQVSRM